MKKPKTSHYDIVAPRSPTLRETRDMAVKVIRLLGGEAGAADKLDGGSFYALAVLAALDVDKRGDEPILGGKKARSK